MYLGPLKPLRPHELSSGKHIPLVKCRGCGAHRVHTIANCLTCGSWDAEPESDEMRKVDPRHVPPVANKQTFTTDDRNAGPI